MKSFSIAETRENLPALIKTAESGVAFEVTRRGHAVAVVLPIQEYKRFMNDKKNSFSKALDEFRADFHPEDESEEHYFDNLRDKSPGREVSL